MVGIKEKYNELKHSIVMRMSKEERVIQKEKTAILKIIKKYQKEQIKLLTEIRDELRKKVKQ